MKVDSFHTHMVGYDVIFSKPQIPGPDEVDLYTLK